MIAIPFHCHPYLGQLSLPHVVVALPWVKMLPQVALVVDVGQVFIFEVPG
jgi:hypothetical protein